MAEEAKCPKCDGSGTVWDNPTPGIGTSRDCPDCKGTGKATAAPAEELKKEEQ